MPRSPTASPRLARRGLFVTTALLGLGLIATAWTSYRGAGALAETVSQGQAERLLQLVREEGSRRGEPPQPEALASVLGNHQGEGLRAVAASPGDVTASVRVDDDRLLFTVSDRGAGIPDGETERIFEPFHTTKTRGVGLGLTVARRVVELHGGTITARNHPGGGAVIEVAIPRTA